jgi:hypothetical protein
MSELVALLLEIALHLRELLLQVVALHHLIRSKWLEGGE